MSTTVATVHIDRLLETCIRIEAQEIYLHVGMPPALGFADTVRNLETKRLDATDLERIAASLLPANQKPPLDADGAARFEFEFGKKGRFATTITRELGSLAIVLKLIKRN